jgi:aryl-alcohol dehydrogenase-like predicted oxidoreductase
MEYRTLGKTGLRVSALGFGCGNVGGLMVRGTPAERERAAARAFELGINYFDTAPLYGDGTSERNLGETLRALHASPYVGTKFRLAADDSANIATAVARSLEASLSRLHLERVDLLQCHNPVAASGTTALPSERVLGEVVPALERLRDQGKIRFYGITALGESAALGRVLEAGTIDTAQMCVNLLNPSAVTQVPRGYPAQDFARLGEHARDHGVGVIVIRVLAAGALSGLSTRHPIAVPEVAPIASGPDYAADVTRAHAFQPLVDEGHVESLVEASLRFPLGSNAVSTVLLGYSSLEHLETAAAAVLKGPLPRVAMDRLGALWSALATTPGRR